MHTEVVQGKAPSELPHPHVIEIEFDGERKSIEQGKYTASQLKENFGIPAEYALDRWQGNQFVPLADGEVVQLHPNDVFVSHVRNGASS